VKVLIVGDEPPVLGALVPAFVGEGHSVEVCPDAATVVARARFEGFDLLVVCSMRGGVDAAAIGRRVRNLGRTEPMLLVLDAGNEAAAADALDAGFDDAQASTFDAAEVLARAVALVGRLASDTRLRAGALEVDRVQRRAWLHGGVLPLTAREFELLVFLVEHAGRVVSPTELLARLRRTEASPTSNLLQVHVSRLREKLGDYASHVETVRGMGYRLRA
jgi:DNA-binding response OmpR family regulator